MEMSIYLDMLSTTVWHLLAPDGGRVRSGFRPHQRLLEEGVGREACEGGEGGQEEDGAGSWACGLAGGSRAGNAGRVFLVEDCGARTCVQCGGLRGRCDWFKARRFLFGLSEHNTNHKIKQRRRPIKPKHTESEILNRMRYSRT